MMAKELSNNGAKVYITGRRLEVLQKTAAEAGFIPYGISVFFSSSESILMPLHILNS
jgi:NADP-dependent 3-hydroxy acid dehydrogenase YdfG